jgi:hypothetical protein
MKKLFIVLLTCFLILGCEKHVSPRQSGKKLEFYLIKDFQRVGTSAKIINSTVNLSDSVIIYYDEILSYNSNTHTFKVTDSCAENLDDFQNNNIHGKAFAVTIDKKVIYTGYFWCGFSSSIVDWITIDPLNYIGNNQLRVSLGYPGLIQGDYIPDKRNDYLILETLRKDGKLIE